ncbi:hypothetical protein Tco_1127145, partial [Tanacetum coccineum]
GGGPRCQETIGDTIAQTRVLDLENTKTSQDSEIAKFKRMVKKLEKKKRSRTHVLKRLYRVGSSRRVESYEDKEFTLVDETQGRYGEEIMFDVSDLTGEEVYVEETRSVVKEVNTVIEKAKLVSAAEETISVVATTVSTASTIPVIATTTTNTTTATITDVEITLAQAMTELKSIKPKADKVVIQEPKQSTTTTTNTIPTLRKGIIITELGTSTTTTTISSQPSQRLDEELAFKLQAEEEEEEEERLSRVKAQQIEEANIAWDDIQARIKRRKHFAALKAKEKRNKPPTKAQKRNTMSTYLKNMTGYKHNQLKNKSFNDIQKLFNKEKKRVNTFVEMDTELVKGNETRVEGKDEDTVDVIPLAVKHVPIMFRVFTQMLKGFDREDLETIYRLVKDSDLSRRYSTSVMKTKAATYEIRWIEDLRLKFVEMISNFPRLRLQDIEDMLLLLVQQRLTSLTIDERSDLRNITVYTSYSAPHGRIYMDNFYRKRLIRADELHKNSDDMLNDVRTALNDISKEMRMEYLPKRKWIG